MKLNIIFPENLTAVNLLRQKMIPCVCMVAGADFSISFREPLIEASGTVVEWDRKELEERALAGAGGRYSHYKHAQISLRPLGDNFYSIIDLSLFYSDVGWCPVIINGGLAPPGKFWDEE
jgi:hypothetical protein